MKLVWSDERSLRFEGEFYSLKGMRPGPHPVHDIGIWVGPRSAVAVAYGDHLATVWVEPGRDDLFERLRIGEDWPVDGFADAYVNGAADPSTGRLGYTLPDPPTAAGLALLEELPFGDLPRGRAVRGADRSRVTGAREVRWRAVRFVARNFPHEPSVSPVDRETGRSEPDVEQREQVAASVARQRLAPAAGRRPATRSRRPPRQWDPRGRRSPGRPPTHVRRARVGPERDRLRLPGDPGGTGVPRSRAVSTSSAHAPA